MKANWRLAAILFVVQVVMYCVITYNWRMIAQARVPEALLSDLIYGAANFFVIRKIAASGDQLVPWAGYTLGGVLGTWLGIEMSRWLVI
jgi:hypothetical protein